jgi:hypothetical protein
LFDFYDWRDYHNAVPTELWVNRALLILP